LASIINARSKSKREILLCGEKERGGWEGKWSPLEELYLFALG